MATNSPEEITRLEEAVKAQGLAVRDLKTASAEKEQIDDAVKVLLGLKKELAAAKGEPDPTQKSKKDKKKKEKQGPTKKELRIMQQEAEARARAKEACKPMQEAIANDDHGMFALVQSTGRTERVFTPINELTPELAGTEVWIRGYAQAVRGKGKAAFMFVRSTIYTVQVAAFAGQGTSKDAVKFMQKIHKESIVDILAEVTVPPEPVEKATQHNVELSARKVFVVSDAINLPFQIEDASQPGTGDDDQDEVNAGTDGAGPADNNEEDGERQGFANVKQDTRLDHRWIDIRTLANQGIFRVQAAVQSLFRDFLTERNFVEIHTPKLIGTASEGGADVFELNYFGGKAYLAQSPQLYKQMAVISGLERVFEIGPVFRAENSNTNRHLTEFMGMDLEMAFQDDYHEVLDLMSELFIHIFDGLASEKYAPILAAVNQQHEFEPLEYLRPSLVLTYPEAIAMLREAGKEIGDLDDLSTEMEKFLGSLVKERYHTDFYILDKFPLKKRPFYTMPDPENPDYSNSYDIFIRGQEIMSGAQRIHDPELLEERAAALGVDLTPIQAYVDSFKHGALPHAGGGIGLERVTMLYLGLTNIRKTTMFPRDPSRLTP